MLKITATILTILIVGMILTTNSCDRNPTKIPTEDSWKEVLDADLHLLGHRNWILVVDKAFPEQSSPGMKYIYVEEDLLPTLQYVLGRVESSTHVNPVIYRDKELDFVSEMQVPGIEEFRNRSAELLEGRSVNTLLHTEVFELLDESASLFRVLVIKTNCTLPYTSVFLQMDCAYWNGNQEKVLRESMSDSSTSFSQ
jgi:hypothetical protein